jgi:hypothetical protein
MMRLLKKLPPPSDLGSSRDSVPCPTPYSLLRETRVERDTIPCPYSILRRFRPVVRVSAVLNGDRKFKPHARVGLGTSKQTDSSPALSPSRCPPLFANQSMMPNGECLCRFACKVLLTAAGLAAVVSHSDACSGRSSTPRAIKGSEFFRSRTAHALTPTRTPTPKPTLTPTPHSHAHGPV